MHSGFKSCPSCREQYDQCLVCHFYTVDGERIYYQKLENFGATNDSEVRFIQHIQRHSTIAFFHNGKLHIPSRQGRSVPLAIGLQWGAWQEQQKRIEELESKVTDLNKNLKDRELAVLVRQSNIDAGLAVIQKWKEARSVFPLYQIEQALKGGDE
ncbi:hypothetical protein ACX1N5_04040 [Acinetobacter sp. ANC 4636]